MKRINPSMHISHHMHTPLSPTPSPHSHPHHMHTITTCTHSCTPSSYAHSIMCTHHTISSHAHTHTLTNRFIDFTAGLLLTAAHPLIFSLFYILTNVTCVSSLPSSNASDTRPISTPSHSISHPKRILALF